MKKTGKPVDMVNITLTLFRVWYIPGGFPDFFHQKYHHHHPHRKGWENTTKSWWTAFLKSWEGRCRQKLAGSQHLTTAGGKISRTCFLGSNYNISRTVFQKLQQKHRLIVSPVRKYKNNHSAAKSQSANQNYLITRNHPKSSPTPPWPPIPIMPSKNLGQPGGLLLGRGNSSESSDMSWRDAAWVKQSTLATRPCQSSGSRKPSYFQPGSAWTILDVGCWSVTQFQRNKSIQARPKGETKWGVTFLITYIQEKSETSDEIWIRRIYEGFLQIDSETWKFWSKYI